MSQVKAMVAAPDHTLVVVIGMHDIECGIVSGKGSRKQWVKDSLLRASIEGENVGEVGLRALAAVLQTLYTESTVAPVVKQIRVVVADGWLAVGRVLWSPNLKRAATAELYARAQMVASGFDLEASDLIRLDEAPYMQPHLVFGYPGMLLEALNQLAQRLNAHLASVLPLSVAFWEIVRSRKACDTSILAIQDDGLLLFARGAGRFNTHLDEVTVRVDSNPGVTSPIWLQDAWQRLVLREPHLEGVSQVAVLDLKQSSCISGSEDSLFKPVTLPVTSLQLGEQEGSLRLRLGADIASVRHVLDAISRPSPVSPLQWFAAGAASLLAGALILDAAQAHHHVQTLTAQVNEMGRPVTSNTQPVNWNREELAQVHAVNTAIRQLNMPISAILRALHPPQDIHVAVLGMETSGSAMAGQASGIKIIAEARTGAEMARYVAFLSERRPLAGAYLMRHEIDETLPEHPYRFTVEALWTE